jgi:mono/diheme cytochrome c family protein
MRSASSIVAGSARVAVAVGAFMAAEAYRRRCAGAAPNPHVRRNAALTCAHNAGVRSATLGHDGAAEKTMTRLAMIVLGGVMGTIAAGVPQGHASAQGAAKDDAARGAKLFANTRGESGKPVGNCIACHANQEALREMLRNRGARPDDAVAVRALLARAIDGAQPGAADAKAQYRGVLTTKDLRDLAAYLASTRRG